MHPRWNPDNPTSSASSLPSTPSTVHQPRTPTPSTRRTGAHLTSTVFAASPPPRVGMALASRTGRTSSIPPRMADGAYETKQTAFEWPVRDVRDLKARLEAGDDDDNDDDAQHEALTTEGAYFDDLAYKLHIERTPGPLVRPDPEVEPVATQEPSIVLAIIALWAKYSDLPLDETFDRSVFVGIKAYEREGEHVLGEPKWLWSASEVVAFSKRQEFWDVTLPPLSTLLDLPEVSARDAFSIRVVVKHASQPGLPPMVHADQQYISRRVTRQAAAFLDSIRTGDVQFVCLEHAGTGTPDEDGPRKMVRRRVVYAHSELLVHSDYFKATLSGGFAEGSQAPVTTLLVEDAAFNTVYWVLRWLYTDEILFSNVDSVRTVMAQVRVDTAIARRVLQLESWEYASLVPEEEVDDADIRTVRSTSSVGTAASGRLSPGARSAASVASTSSPRRGPAPPIPSSSSSSTSTPRPPRPKSSSPTSATQPRLSRPPAAVPRIATTPASGSTAAAAGRKMGPQTSPVAAGGSGASAPTSPPCARNFIPRRSHAPPPDPHKHPTKPPAPPSPLAVFFLAHRYGLEDLQVLARDALLRNLTPDTCIAALLATYAFGDLHAAVMDYVSDHWAEVCASPELDRCYQEVSAGVWGELHGGQVLLGLTRRLTGMSI